MRPCLTFLLRLVLLLGMLAVSGCADQSTIPVAPVPGAHLMVVHASPGGPSLDVVLNGSLATTAVTFPNNTAYLDLPVGTTPVAMPATGTSAPNLINASVTASAGSSYSMFLVDTTSLIHPLLVADDLTTPAGGTARVRFLHLSPNAPALDVTRADGTVVLANQHFLDVNPFITAPAATVDLELRVAGTDSVLAFMTGLKFASGHSYTLWAQGLVGGAGARALAAQLVKNR